jgi:AcrR family transcriptional regulator
VSAPGTASVAFTVDEADPTSRMSAVDVETAREEDTMPATGHETSRPHASSRGRPRDASRDAALRTAALEVMAEVGYRALTMDAVAARARAGKATIYRRWDSKLDLVIDTCNQLVQRNIPEPDTGSLERDLRDILSGFATFLTGPAGKAGQALVGELPHEPELAAAFRESFLLPQRDVLRRIVERGIERGEARADAPVDTVVEVAGAVLIHRLMLTGEPLDSRFVERVLNEALLPLLR